MFRGMRSKTAPGLSSQSRIVRCPKCRKLLQEPIDATTYKCSGCDSILQAKRWELEANGNSIPEAILSSQNCSVRTDLESAKGGSKTPIRNTHREYNSKASPSVERGHHSETVYKHEASDIRREWMRRADEFSETHDTDVFASARSSPYNSRSNASEWTQHEGRYEEPLQVPFYPASPSPSSAYDYGCSSPFHGSQLSALEQSYYHHQPREGWFQEFSAASPIRFPGETSDGKYYRWSSQYQLHDLPYHNLYESSSSATPHRSERSYQAAAAPYSSTYSERSVGISRSETSTEKSSLRDKRKYVRERNPVVKRYVLPSAGGAPFATCSYCLELLQLPQVSLHGKHKRYQVRCGSCSGVLKFSIGEKADTVLDSPSFVDSGTDVADETVTIYQDSASEGHEEFYPNDSHLSSSENSSGNRISGPYAHFHSTTEPSEIVGLRHALYQTQTSPLRSPLTSPIHTPIGSPLHYLKGSQMRSPIASPMHSHIVSPLRSPINTSGSLSDVLFLYSKRDDVGKDEFLTLQGPQKSKESPQILQLSSLQSLERCRRR